MTEVKPFTAAQVREHADRLRFGGVIAVNGQAVDMLDAFAQRLEQEENPAIGYTKAYMRADVAAYIASLREEGRREILREIDDPVVLRRESEMSGKHFECLFCHATNSTHRLDYKEVDHERDCLWLRAQQVTP